MSKRASKKKQSTTRAEADACAGESSNGYYVYCIGACEQLRALFDDLPPGQLKGLAIEESSGLELVERGEMAAVVSAVPLALYAEEPLAERLTDATWAATRAMRHERAVEHFAQRAGVVPLRFGTIYLRRQSIEQMLEERHAELASVITRIEGRDEWGVNLYADREKLREGVVDASPRLREMSERAAQLSPGQAYLLRKQVDAMRAAEARAETKRIGMEVERELGAASDAVARLRVLSLEATEHGELAAKFAFLVRRERYGDFQAAAERLAERYDALGFKFELTGPWPAYNFVARGEEAGRQ